MNVAAGRIIQSAVHMQPARRRLNTLRLKGKKGTSQYLERHGEFKNERSEVLGACSWFNSKTRSAVTLI